MKQWRFARKFNEFIYFHLGKLLSVHVAAIQLANAPFITGEVLILLSLFACSELFIDCGEAIVTVLYWKEIQTLFPTICTDFCCLSLHEWKA